MIKTLSITKAREELTTLVDNANKRLDEYVITVNGSPAAVLMSAKEFESWKETIDILSDPQLMQAIKQGEAEATAGKTLAWDKVKKEIELD